MKICSKCNKEKPLTEFNKRNSKKNSYSSYCKNCCKLYNTKWYGDSKEKINKKHKDYYEINKEKIIKKQIEYYEKNKTDIIKKQRKYIQRPEIRKRRREIINIWTKEKIKTDPNFRIRRTISTRIWHALRGIGKIYKTEKLLGCTLEEAKNHLQSQFKKGMTWNNYGKWHIDHIKPCDSFDLRNPEEQMKCFNYKNLQPLWARENLLKNNKII